jgi:mRNA interferase RelE/StbE
MAYVIILAPEAVADLRRLSAHERAKVRDAIEVHLRHEPTKVSKSRIKRLRGKSRPQFRLRVEAFRVFYDIEDEEVRVLAVVAKADADAWLKEAGQRDEESPPLGDQG